MLPTTPSLHPSFLPLSLPSAFPPISYGVMLLKKGNRRLLNKQALAGRRCEVPRKKPSVVSGDGSCGHQLLFFVTWLSPAPSGAPSYSCSHYTHRPHQPPSLIVWLPPRLPHLRSSHPHCFNRTQTHSIFVCTHTTNLCVHNLYQTCSNSPRSYLYTLRTTNFLCTSDTVTAAHTTPTYFQKMCYEKEKKIKKKRKSMHIDCFPGDRTMSQSLPFPLL